ncbi:hypothetical protein [Novosphingobium sp. PY1]|uniref:hypothetical protein n=1 Tax=Novosphingobium sp. PY1 TaxID=1882221 RepID=UPI001A8C3CAE|nr:hypothetical protein [Novosphingobium sp. PY1]GFM28674.1 uncharacterized protein PY1_contig-05-68 [Novosphingobium sp. PY1]
MRILSSLLAIGTAIGLSAATATPALAGQGQGQGQTCSPEFVQSSQSVTVTGLEIGTNAPTSENFQVRLRNDGNGQCGAALRVARLSTSPSSDLAFILRSGGSVFDILPTETSPGTTSSDVYVPGISGGTNGRALPFVLTVPGEWGMAAGTRQEQLLLSLIGTDGTVFDTMILNIVIDVPPSVELRIVGVTGNNEIAGINLGTLDPQAVNVSDPFGVRIWSTSPYSVTFQSDHMGKLAHDSLGDAIPYKLRMDGSLVDVKGGQAVHFGTRTDSLGDLHPLEVTVEPFTARAGDYSDRVLVTVTAS